VTPGELIRRGTEGPGGAASRSAMRSVALDTKIAGLLLVLFAVLYVSTVTKGEDGYNGASRLAVVQAIVEQHTFSIDRSLYAPVTMDKAYVHGHYYSDKALGQSLVAVPVYWVLYRLGISFARHQNLAEIALKTPFALLAACVPALFFLASKPYAPSLRTRLAVSVALGAGTGILVLSGVFFSHSSVAALLLMSFYFARRAREGNTNWLWLSGATGGMAILFEYPALFLVAAIHLTYLGSRQRKLDVGKAIVAALPFVVCILVINLRITGNPLDFPYYHTADWPGSPLHANTNRFELRQISLARAGQMFFFSRSTPQAPASYQGLFLYSPFLLLGLFFAKKEHVVLLLGCLAVAVFYLGAVTFDAVGGCTFSNRYLVITVPFLALPALQFAHHWPRVFSITAGASVVMNFIGVTVPLACAPFTLGAVFSRLPTLVRNAGVFWALAVVLLVLFPAVARKAEAVAKDIAGRVQQTA
jgi:hypothetical protein